MLSPEQISQSDAADQLAAVCRSRGYKSTKSQAARYLALRMAKEAFERDDNAVKLLTALLEGDRITDARVFLAEDNTADGEEVADELIEAAEQLAQEFAGYSE